MVTMVYYAWNRSTFPNVPAFVRRRDGADVGRRRNGSRGVIDCRLSPAGLAHSTGLPRRLLSWTKLLQNSGDDSVVIWHATTADSFSS